MAFPPLTEGMVECIRGYASEVLEPGGTSIFTRGQRDGDMFVVLEGNINIYTADERNDIESVIDIGPRQFTGEINMLNDQGTLVGGRTTVDSVLLRVTRDNLQRLMRAEGEVANLIMQAFIWRRIGLMSQARAGVILYGHEGDAETLKLQRFLARNGYPHRLLSKPGHESAPRARLFLRSRTPGRLLVSTMGACFIDLPSLCSPTNSASPSCRMRPESMTSPLSGPVPPAWQSASMLHRKVSQRLSSKALLRADRPVQVPRLRTTSAFPRGSQVKDSHTVPWMQSLKFGVRFAISREAVAIERHSDVHKITLEGGLSFCSRAVVIATGAQYRKLQLDNFEKFENQGVYYAATAMEIPFCRNHEAVVVGGGNSAGQAALFLSQIAAHVYLMIRGKSLAETMSQYLLSRIEKSPRISILTETEIESLDGGSRLEQVTWGNRRDGSKTSKRIDSVFVMIGAQPNTSWLKGVVNLDEKGFVRTGGSRSL